MPNDGWSVNNLIRKFYVIFGRIENVKGYYQRCRAFFSKKATNIFLIVLFYF